MNKTLQARLGAAVRLCRKGLGISQEELAWRADMHRTYLADIERGRRNISLGSINSLAEALQISIGSLLNQAQDNAETAGAGDRVHWSESGEILLVEDTPSDVELSLRAFRRANLVNPVKVVRDGAEALHYVFGTGRYSRRSPGERPALVLLDLNLPKATGLEVLQRLKADDRTRNIPVIVLTISREDATILECARLGAVNYILKPVSFENLCRATPNLNLRWALLNAP